eukprot:CAMPEP_0113944566 /NCGR_PEP_ID=MMETSP1339-20121228/34501_1 /TAXON_ID=94617 /ORGANISM="Fibrocapsa japonica" /LENGTH=236 /DNA_ID=CAMNT_0000949803 /DNA_START=85 /DNA_END=795 /DNA_ORIENTATION=- /assembly_acc=CAM_ASM_000762
MEGRKTKKWFPLESNPEVMNTYIQKLGFDTSAYQIVDVFSTEEWALAMVPQPVAAVLLLFPIKEASEQHKSEEEAIITESGQEVSSEVYYMKQTVGNACGTVALLHAAGNLSKTVPPVEGSFLQKFMERTSNMSPEEIAEALHDDDEIEDVHGDAAQQGQTEATMDVATHFVCFVEKEGCMYELDGRKKFPINHGASSPESLLADACRVVQGFMARDPEEVKFTITALAPTAGGDP